MLVAIYIDGSEWNVDGKRTRSLKYVDDIERGQKANRRSGYAGSGVCPHCTILPQHVGLLKILPQPYISDHPSYCILSLLRLLLRSIERGKVVGRGFLYPPYPQFLIYSHDHESQSGNRHLKEPVRRTPSPSEPSPLHSLCKYMAYLTKPPPPPPPTPYPPGLDKHTYRISTHHPALLEGLFAWRT